jgi:hypothetical protein
MDKAAVRSAPLSRCVHEMRASCCSYKFERESPRAKQLFKPGYLVGTTVARLDATYRFE